MIPQRNPIHSFSARCASCDIRVASHSSSEESANARAAAMSNAADDDRPAPIGISPATVPSHPLSV
jgi:hypothetical protein